MGTNKKDKGLEYNLYTYDIGPFQYIPGDPVMNVTGIKGKDNFPHDRNNTGEKNRYNGHGGYLAIPLGRLDLAVHYVAKSVSTLSTMEIIVDEGDFVVDILQLVKRNLLRSKGDPIKKISSKDVDELNKVSGNTLTSHFFELGKLPPDIYLTLLNIIHNMTNLKRQNSNYVVIDAGILEAINEDEKGVISLYERGILTLPKNKLGNARVGEKGSLVYPDAQKKYPGLFFHPDRI